MRTTKPTPISETLSLFKDNIDKRQKYVKNEFQAYGLQLATELGDWKNKSLYIRLAKTEDRKLLEKALYFVKDHPPRQIKTPYRLFMWKLKQLRMEKETENI